MSPEYNHQITAFHKLQNHDVFALIMEQGTGKSRPIVKDWLARIQQDRAQDLVVLGPKGAYMNWIGDDEEPGELDKWIPANNPFDIYIDYWISHASATKRQALQNLLHATGPRFLAMNIEALNRSGDARKYLLDFIGNRKVIGCIDESTTICHEEAARTQFLLDDVAHKFKARRILSGLVVPESPLDLYTQYHFLDWKILGQRSFWGFKNRYAIMEQVDYRNPMQKAEDAKRGKKGRKTNIVVDFRNMHELHDKMMRYSYRVTKAEALDLPPKIYQFYDVDLTPQQEIIYTEMKTMTFARLLEGQFATANGKLDQLGKLQHILCGHVRNEMGEISDIPENRTDAVVEILHRHTGKAIIWCPYPKAIIKITERLRHEFGDDSTVDFYGDTSPSDRLHARSRIQNDDLCRFIVSNQSVGKFGNTWTACNLVIYYINSFDNEDRQQSEDRAHRIGQTKSVTYIDLRARGTIDEKLVAVLRKKMSIAATLQGDGFREWLI